MNLDTWVNSLKEKEIEIIDSKYVKWGKKDEKIPPYISSGEWVIGGRRGGSCWDSGEGPDPHHGIDSEPEPDFVQLDKLLEIVWPNISHLQYKNLVRELVTREERHEDEYYGNYTNYEEKRIDLAALLSYLKERHVIS